MTNPTKFRCYKFPATGVPVTVTVSRAVVPLRVLQLLHSDFVAIVYSSTLATYLATLVSHAFSFQINSNKLNILLFALFYVSGN